MVRSFVAVVLIVAGSVGTPAPAQSQQGTLHEITLPAPWGPFTPSVHTVLFTDSTRLDPHASEDGAFRPILVRLWIPSDEAGGPSRPYMPPQVADAWRSTMPAADGFETAVTTNSRAGAALSSAREKWPVLLFSPGRSFPVENYQIALEYLASRGWIVAAVSPPYEEALTLLPDGRALPFSGPRWEDESERGTVLMGVVDEMVMDASLVLDRLEALSETPGTGFTDRLDFSAGVGYLGHSLGGAAAVWAMERDPRITAAVSWEGQVYRDEDRPLQIGGGDLLYMIGGANRAELAGTQFRPGARGIAVHELVIHGAWHASFGDMLHIYREYADRAWLERHRREVFADRVNQITNDYVHEFFAQALLDQEPDLLWPDSLEQLGSPSLWNYPEVELRTYVR